MNADVRVSPVKMITNTEVSEAAEIPPQFVLSLDSLKFLGPCLVEVLILVLLTPLLFFPLQTVGREVPVHFLTSAKTRAKLVMD